MLGKCSKDKAQSISKIHLAIDLRGHCCYPVAGEHDFGTLDCSGSNYWLGDRVLVIIAVMEKAIEMIL